MRNPACRNGGCENEARDRSSYCSEACFTDDQGYAPAELVDPNGQPFGGRRA